MVHRHPCSCIWGADDKEVMTDQQQVGRGQGRDEGEGAISLLSQNEIKESSKPHTDLEAKLGAYTSNIQV